MYVTFGNGKLGKTYDVTVEKVDSKNDLWVLRHGIGVELFIKQLIVASRNNDNLVYLRYIFPTGKTSGLLKKLIWDREIQIKKHMTDDGYDIKFINIPDFNKRREVCGYDK
jgi:hypothetical protein